MNWEKQFESMIDSGQLDNESINDLAVVYVAETGDEGGFGWDWIAYFELSSLRIWAGAISYSWGNKTPRSRSVSGRRNKSQLPWPGTHNWSSAWSGKERRFGSVSATSGTSGEFYSSSSSAADRRTD